jgi:hypothetical protein
MTRIEFPEVMGITQASAYLDVAPDTLYDYAKNGTLPAFKLWQPLEVSQGPA